MELFSAIHATLQGTPNRRGWYDATCPNCGKEPEKGQVHFGYHPDGRVRCFVCGYSASLYKLSELLRLDVGEYVAPVKIEKPTPPIARWRLNPDKLLQQYQTHPQRLTKWYGYKPLTDDNIERYHLGYGRLPFQRDDGTWYMSKAEWLTVPVYEDGALIALRGRNVTDSGPKWISATGSQYGLFGVEYVYPGATTFICENYADAIWLQQAHPDWCAVAIGGATTWRNVWAYRLAQKRPGLVVVALDNDLPGNGGGILRDGLIAEWTAAHPQAAVPTANGPRIANDCIEAGLRTILFQWPDTAPAKAGLDWALTQPQPLF
jgi:hypothetical protein